ncbi:lipid A biosynthesis lauroyl acyltransferase [Pseudoxanthomonas kalamensis DSM 18571]|uniref:lauroyl acyltransferase n=1 Tax=Pseudoxanthomonas kalamensis TaxID=289483 RepID=UPI0013918B00|nr:lauroyl acyltransferase [Pseudoxanthomonas kalamensis]KAF1712093.1 lipid A biosynthesis lauroyl acyltransferase [Pseudoxanthomonas kalamensis DSM 18571]
MTPETQASLLYRGVALLARLPWPWLRRLADAIAWLWRRIDARESRVARRNIELVYPELLPAQRRELHRAILHTTARQAMETLRFWTRPAHENLARLSPRDGEPLYDQALASGRGVIVIAPHFGNWELLNQWLASRGPISILYAPPESAMGDAFLNRVRGADAITQVRAEEPAVRQLWKALKDGGAVGILPDQQPKQGDGEFAPFFGIPALTMTLVSRLAERTDAIVLCAWCERTGPDLQFALHVEPAPAQIADPDLLQATTALNACIEHVARRDPAQYQWTYKRFSWRPPGSGEPNPYTLPSSS